MSNPQYQNNEGYDTPPAPDLYKPRTSYACGEVLGNGRFYFCDSCAKCDISRSDTPAPAPEGLRPHAAEVIGELASYRADIAALRAELSAYKTMHFDELKLKKNVWDKFELLDKAVKQLYSEVTAVETKLGMI